MNFHIGSSHALSSPLWRTDLPPLVDNPAPSMTFTFSTDMTPIIYSNDPTGPEFLPGTIATESIYSPPGSPVLGATRISHAKKRDASYIPRPPNAFILFRSSFIRAQHVPGKIEGNHSALSKIIGIFVCPCCLHIFSLTALSGRLYRQMLESTTSRGKRSMGSKGYCSSS